jgi:hypothetical protein
MHRLIALSLLCVPVALHAQQADCTISPGMTRAQVVAALGSPATQRTASEFTYMFYPNTCGRACGMNDLVILKHDSVSDAIFRSPSRHYTGTSSSPVQTPPELAPRRARPAAKPMTPSKTDATAAKPAATTQMKPPAKANDATPSIPVKPKPLETAPAKSTTPAKPAAPDKKTPG